MKTICQLLHSLSIGGAEVLAARIGRRLRDRYRFIYLCLDEIGALGQDLAADGFPVHHLGRNAGLDLRCMTSLRQILRREKVDIVHAHQFTPYFYATMARAPRRRPSVLFTEHGRFHPDYPRPKRMLYNKVAIGRRDRVVAVGEAVRQALVNYEGIPSGRVDVIYNGIDLAACPPPSETAREASRAEWDIKPSTLLIAHVARLDPIKDHLTSMRAVKTLVRRGIDARLLIVGDGPEKATIEQACTELGSEHFILAGMRRDVPNILAGADIFLLTSHSEGIPLTVIEAMAAGLPVVSTNVGGLPEVVLEEETGLLAPPRDPDAIAKQLERLSKDPTWARQLGQAGRKLAYDQFSEDAMLAAYEECYQAI